MTIEADGRMPFYKYGRSMRSLRKPHLKPLPHFARTLADGEGLSNLNVIKSFHGFSGNKGA
jgi:hypothetical protein